MVATPTHRQLLSDKKVQDGKISKDMADLRAKHLDLLHPVEAIIREFCPLPIAYDVVRVQPPYCFEFTLTELMGGLWVQAQSSELTARSIRSAINDPVEWDFKPSDHIPLRDKYISNEPFEMMADHYLLEMPTSVAFLPGDNCFEESVSAESIIRPLLADEEILIKPHPMTTEDIIRHLGRVFGYHRIFPPKSSAALILPHLKEAYVTTCTELGLYAVMQGTKIHNISRLQYEASGAAAPIYQFLWNKSVDEANNTLRKILDSPLSGFFYPGDPDLQAKVFAYFTDVMQLREVFRPIMPEYTAANWADNRRAWMDSGNS